MNTRQHQPVKFFLIRRRRHTMTKEKGKESAANLDSYYTKPNNIVDLFEDSVAKFSSRNLFGIKNKEINQY